MQPWPRLLFGTAPMQTSETLHFQTPLPKPQRGGSTRVQLGCNELVLESVRGGHSLLWLDGREARRFALGLDADGLLLLQLRAPRLPICVVPREVLSIVPGGRLRGYLQVPLVPTVVWQPVGGAAVPLVELPPRELGAEWDEGEGARFRCTSSLHVRFPMRSGEASAIVPVVLRNVGDEVVSPGHLPLQLTDEDLEELRGSLVVRPRRLIWTGRSWAAAVGICAEVRV